MTLILILGGSGEQAGAVTITPRTLSLYERTNTLNPEPRTNDLGLYIRTNSITIQARTNALGLYIRTNALNLKDREQ